MIRFIIVGLIAGIILWILESIINTNPLARNLYQVYKPIIKTKLNIPMVIFIYLIYGFAFAGLFLFLHQSLPGTGIVKGISFALLTWFFRGFMAVLSSLMTFNVPVKALVYGAITGFCEALLVGMFYGLTLKKLLPA